MGRLQGKVAIVTGGAKGLGQAMAELFANEGAKVVALDMNDLAYQHKNVEGMILNVADSKACKVIFDKIVEKYGKIDILINNAGITRDALTAKMTDDMWDSVIAVNLKGIFNLTRYVGPHMEVNGKGSIVSISSIVGEYGNIGQANYSATKSAIYGLTKTWAKEFSRKGAKVRVNCVSPGYTLTDIVKTVPEALLKSFAEQTMLKRLGEPEDIAKAVLFLASDEASYITAHNLSVNGGMRL